MTASKPLTLKDLRLQSKKAQKHMAQILGISASYYSLIESGKRPMSLILAGKIARELNTSIDEIYLLSNLTKCKDAL